MTTQEFQDTVWEFAATHTRSMPWRDTTDPYYVLVSEMMLQQTQVERVIPKFHSFIEAFPDFSTLAQASLGDVVQLWSGLGYNRRAKFLWQTAQKVTGEFNGELPESREDLITLPGVGNNTAGAIMAYAFNLPAVFIETNIRTVYFHHFFHDQPLVDDKELAILVERTLDRDQPREWYWALMDYGTYLKKQGVGSIRQSKHYKKQSPLKGSLREMRGRILTALTNGALTVKELQQVSSADDRFDPALSALLEEGFVQKNRELYSLT